MAINNETRIQKTDTIEQLRQKNNEVSLHVGDNGLIDARILDKTESITAAASQTLFTASGLRFEVKPGETIDNNAHTESLSVGVVKVFNGATELTQALSGANTFVAPNHVGTIALTGSPTLTQFAHENVEVYHAASAQTDLTHASVTFRAKVLSCDITNGIRLKNQSGTYSASTALRVHPGSSGRSVSTNTILSSQHTGLTAVDATFGSIIKLNTAASAGNVIKIVSTNLVDAINEVQDDVGNILELGSNNKSDIVTSINELETGLRGTRTGLVAADLSGMTADNVVSAILEHEVDIGNMTLTGLTATNLSAAARELRTLLGHNPSLATTAKASVVEAVNEVHADALASVKLTSASTQTINSNTTYTTGNTILVPTGATLDIRQGNLLVGGGTGASLGFDTAFLNITSNTNQRGLSFERSNYSLGNDVELIFDQTMVAATKGHRAFRIKGLNESGAAISDSGNVNHVYQDLVTFYNAKDLITSNSETGIDVAWDSANGNFDFALTADPQITLAGDVTGTVTLTNLTSSEFTLNTTIGAGTVENTMLAGSIAASKLAGSIGNSKLSNSTITISDGSNTSPVALGGTLTVQGTSSEVTVAESAGTVTVGLPNDVTIGNDLTVTGDLLVQGDTVTLNTSTLAVEDTLVLMGTAGGEPSTGGFGLETRAFTGTTAPHSNAAAGVTGTHSLVYNFATDQWEADGNQILDTVNSLITPQIKTNSGASGHLTPTDLTGTRDLDFIQGSGITIAGALNSTDIDITITNSDKGSSQNIFKNVASTSGTAVADNNNDTLTIVGGNNLTTSVSADTLTIQHDNSGVSAAAYGSQFVVPRITVDARGHLTSVVSQTAISLSALGYSGAPNADNYGSFSIRANANAAEAIGSGDTITFTNSGATTVTRSGNTIDISSANTQLSDAQVRSKFSAGSNVAISSSGVISATDTNTTSFNVNANGGTNENISAGEAIRFNGGGITSVTRSGQTFTISTPNTNTDTTNFNVNANGGANENISAGETIRFNSGGATTVSRSGNTFTISSTDNNDNTQLTAAQVRANFSAGTGISYNASSGVITNTVTNTDTNTVTTNLAGNGISVSSGTGNSTIAMTGSFTGTFTASADVVAFSDKKLKDNIQTLDGSKVFDMRGVSFNRNDQDGKLSSGVIAQELEHIAPELIHESEDGTKGVAYGNTVGYLIEAIKLLKAEIEELKSINKKV
jgi:hypothetical protein